MPRHRSAKTGRAVTAKEAKANPETTVRHGKSKDTKRLDCLQKNAVSIYRSGDGSWTVGTGRAVVSGPTLRKATDNVMKAEPDV